MAAAFGNFKDLYNRVADRSVPPTASNTYQAISSMFVPLTAMLDGPLVGKTNGLVDVPPNNILPAAPDAYATCRENNAWRIPYKVATPRVFFHVGCSL